MQKNSITSWSYGDQLIRSLVRNGEPWFVGRDAAKALGYEKPENVKRFGVAVKK